MKRLAEHVDRIRPPRFEPTRRGWVLHPLAGPRSRSCFTQCLMAHGSQLDRESISLGVGHDPIAAGAAMHIAGKCRLTSRSLVLPARPSVR